MRQTITELLFGNRLFFVGTLEEFVHKHRQSFKLEIVQPHTLHDGADLECPRGAVYKGQIVAQEAELPDSDQKLVLPVEGSKLFLPNMPHRARGRMQGSLMGSPM